MTRPVEAARSMSPPDRFRLYTVLTLQVALLAVTAAETVAAWLARPSPWPAIAVVVAGSAGGGGRRTFAAVVGGVRSADQR